MRDRMSSEGILSVRSVVCTSNDAISSRLADEVVILNLRSGVYHGLEAVGSRIWELIRQPAAVGAVRDALIEEYDVEPDRCERDLLALFEELKAHGLLEVRSDATA
jgi:hypothetical protein